MNVLTSIPLATSELHLARSKCIDAFAGAEAATTELLRINGIAVSNESFSQKLNSLTKVAASPTYSKAHKKSVDEAVVQLKGLLCERADIVHAPLVIADFGREMRACFINARDTAPYGHPARIFSLADFDALTKKLNALVRSMEKPINPASSPPPPAQGAAGDP